MKRGRPPARRSAKAKARDLELGVATAARRRLAGDWCEGATPACRPGAHRGHHAHHVQLRSQGGGHTVENLRWLCWDAHDWVHQNPDAARQLDLYGAPR